MKFQIGKFYRHTTGKEFSIVGTVRTTMFGDTLVAEQNDNVDLVAVGSDESATTNFVEISKEEWMKNFS